MVAKKMTENRVNVTVEHQRNVLLDALECSRLTQNLYGSPLGQIRRMFQTGLWTFILLDF